jgi:hypothetical protein
MDFPTRPVGDPAAIRNAAEQVRQKASALFDVQFAVSGSVTDMRFQGPAAGRIRGDAVAWRSQANASMRELEALANDLDTAANRLEVDLEQYKRAFTRAQRAEDERRREAQRRHL